MNTYGRALQDQLVGGAADIFAAFVAVESINSDGNAGGHGNLVEINANAQPGWTSGLNTTYPRSRIGATAQETAPSSISTLDPALTTTTTTAATTTTTPPTTTTTAATTTTTRPTTTTTAATTTTTAATTTTTTTTARPTTTTTTAAPTTTTTTAATTTTTRPTTTTTRPTTTTTRATTTTTKPSTTTTTRRTTTTTTRRTTTTTASTTTTTLPSLGASLYNSYCADCHDGPALGGGGRNVVGARTCSIDGAINGTSVFPNGVPDMQWLQGQLSDAEIQAISDSLNSNPATGKQRYITACAGCHGVDARGGRVGEGVRGASAGDVLEAIHEERPMGYLGCLPASDIKNIGKYLKGSKRGGGGHGDDDHD